MTISESVEFGVDLAGDGMQHRLAMWKDEVAVSTPFGHRCSTWNIDWSSGPA